MSRRNASIITAYTTLFTVAAGVLYPQLFPISHPDGGLPDFRQSSLSTGNGSETKVDRQVIQSPSAPSGSGNSAEKREAIEPARSAAVTNPPSRS